MPKTYKIYLIKDIDGKKLLGEIIFSGNKFQAKISPKKDFEAVEKLLRDFFENGFLVIGDVFLDKPIKPADPLFLNEVRNQLARNGYLLIEKNKPEEVVLGKF